MDNTSIESAVWVIPQARGEGKISLNMEEVYLLEHRKNEISSVTKVSAKNLMRAFEKGFQRVSRYYAVITEQLALIEEDCKSRDAEVQLTIAPKKLKELGLLRPGFPAGSDDLRRSVVQLDTEYKALMTKHAELTAFKELIKAKQEGFKMAFYSVKAVYDSLDNGVPNSMEEEYVEKG